MFTLSIATVKALQTIDRTGYTALASACCEAAIAEASVRELAAAIRSVSFLTCGQAALAAGLKAAKANGHDHVKTVAAMKEAAATVAAKAKAKADEAAKKNGLAKLARAEAETAAMRLAIHGTPKEQAAAKLAEAEAAAEAAAEAYQAAKDARGNAEAAVKVAREAFEAAEAAEAAAEAEAAKAAEAAPQVVNG